jgi:hypothetical protein
MFVAVEQCGGAGCARTGLVVGGAVHRLFLWPAWTKVGLCPACRFDPGVQL